MMSVVLSILDDSSFWEFRAKSIFPPHKTACPLPTSLHLPCRLSCTCWIADGHAFVKIAGILPGRKPLGFSTLELSNSMEKKGCLSRPREGLHVSKNLFTTGQWSHKPATQQYKPKAERGAMQPVTQLRVQSVNKANFAISQWFHLLQMPPFRRDASYCVVFVS